MNEDAVDVRVGGPLAGLLVIDATHALAGPYCTLQLGELGARVVKVETPDGGDEARRFPPAGDGTSVYFRSINRGKESIALDLKDASDRTTFDALLSRADVLVENFRPGAMERLGYGWPALHARWPRLVAASISGFGQDGPYRTHPAYDLVAQAMGGLMSITGQPDGPPTRVGISIGDLAAGLFAAIAIEAALIERSRTGCGSFVDVAMLDCQVALLENAVARFHETGEVPRPTGSRHPLIAPFDVFRTADAPLALCVGNDAQFGRLARVLDRTGWIDEPRYATVSSRSAHQASLKDAIEAVLRGEARAVWLPRLEAAEVPCGPVNDMADVAADPQVEARGMLLRVDGEGDDMRYAAMPYRLSTMPRRSRHVAAPALDQHRAAILASLGIADPAPVQP